MLRLMNAMKLVSISLNKIESNQQLYLFCLMSPLPFGRGDISKYIIFLWAPSRINTGVLPSQNK